MYSFVFACVKTSVISKTKLIDLIWTWIDYSIIVSIILLPDCPATCTCFVSFSLFSRVTISVVQKRKSVVGPTTPLPGGRGWGGTPLYKRYRYVPPHRVGFLRRFGLKMSIHFANFALESGMVSRELREYMNVFIVLIPNEWERTRNTRIRNGFEEFFVCALI